MLRKLSYFKTVLYKLLLRLWVAIRYQDKKQRKQKLKEWTTKAEKKYLKRYLYAIDTTLTRHTPQTTPVKKIWICWLQGEENAPDIVKSCIQSVRRQMPDYEIILITNDNMSQYITFPDYIYKKKKKDRITNIQFSDILRISLLKQYGGIWLDATVFLSAPLDKKITDSEFFAYHSNIHLKNNSWLLQSAPHHLLMENMQNLMFAYWQHENRMLNYFLYHLFFDLMIEESPACRQEWEKVPVLYDSDCYDLADSLLKPFKETEFSAIKQKNSVHKLTYKYKKDKPTTGTFLEHLIQNKK